MEPTGRVLQVSVSAGGVPKHAVDYAWVGPYGLDGDKHREFTVHGGPHQAVCLFGIEAIERLQTEGHPVVPGSVGENLTTSGIEWSLLPQGTRARVGESLELEVSWPAMPCKTQIKNFKDGKFSRMSINIHPSDSRMYARVLREGEVRPGDPITILPPLPESRAVENKLLSRLDIASAKANAASWKAAKESGFDVDIVEDGDISMASAPGIPGPAFNNAVGLAQYPNLLEMATDFYDAHRAEGWLWMEQAPWRDAQPETTATIFAAAPEDVPDFAGPAGLSVRVIGPDEVGTFVDLYGDQMADSGLADEAPNPWPAVYQRLASWPHRYLFMAELDGKPVAASSLHVHRQTGWLRGGVVRPEARGHGIQRALIAARARKAAELDCDLVGSMAEPDGPSATNLGRMMRAIGVRRQYRYQPAGVTAPVTVA